MIPTTLRKQFVHAEANNIANAKPDLVKELANLIIGERVTEPAGFANTYHHWTGKDGSITSEADNWSDYTYGNAGIDYMSETGAPEGSWIASMTNNSGKASVAKVDTDLNVLGLQIGGGKSPQKLLVGNNQSVSGRNEIRVTANELALNGGTAHSLRRIEIHQGGTLSGHGKLRGNLYSIGTLSITTNGLNVSGHANLGGILKLSGAGTKNAEAPIIEAHQVVGRFDNPDNIVTHQSGAQFTIQYGANSVSLRPH